MQTFSLMSIISIATTILILWFIKRDQLPVTNAIWWLVTAALILLLGLFPGLVDMMAGVFGIAYAPSLAFIFAILILIIKALMEDMEVSKTRRRQIRMAQKLALLEQQLKQSQQQLDFIASQLEHGQDKSKHE